MRAVKVHRLLAGASILAMGFLAQPVLAQDGDEYGDAAANTHAALSQASSIVGADKTAQANGTASANTDAPQAIVPNAGTIRSFYGPATGAAGTIRSFRGELEADAGTIRSFDGDAAGQAGTIRSFAGTIRSFAGTIRSFQDSVLPGQQQSVAFWGNLQPNAGTIRSFGGEFESHAGTIRSFAGTIRSFQDPATGYPELMGHLNDLIGASKARYGAAVQRRTGQSFDQAITGKLLSKYGIDPSDPATLDLNELGLELFLLDWYDNVNAYSGQDSVDGWMQQVNWTPALTVTLGSGFDSRIGLLDFSVTGEGTGNIVKTAGISGVAGGHGSAVLSLIAGAHDGFGVMGIAPRASVVSYNPFDETMTAGWDDIREGVKFLTKNDASVINMSLGVPGHTLASGWNEVFSSDSVSKEARKRVFVLSAGNDGIVQTQDVDWNFDKNPEIIVVGSVDPLNNISSFSNQPGTACLIAKQGCDRPENMLMNRFIVAPGEMILVSDGAGGVTRLSGTSFAAPLVSGTIALMHDRWPWLAKNPDATVGIVLGSARDLGDPGTDPVYGRGLLDVKSALSPLDWNKLHWQISLAGQKPVSVNAASVRTGGQWLRNTWEAWGAYVVAFEITGNTFRDFTIPLSSKLVGQTVGKSEDQFMAYLQSRFWNWATPQYHGGPGSAGLRFASGVDVPLTSVGDWTATLSVSPSIDERAVGKLRQGPETMLALEAPGGKFAIALGQGQGARAFSSHSGFTLASDFALATGGVNPLLSFASGGAFGQVSYALNDRLDLRVAMTQKEQERDLETLAPRERLSLAGLQPSSAKAGLLTLDYQVHPTLSASVSYTLLDEESGLLGMQSLDQSDFRSGTRTDAVTMGAKYAVTPTLSLAASATMGRTRQGDLSRQNIAVSSGGLINTAFQFAMTKNALFAPTDIARLTIAQPLHVESGSIDVASTQVVDRLTGQLGTVVQTVGLDTGPRTFLAEALYGRSLLDGAGSLNLFGRAMLQGQDQNVREPGFTVGTSVSLRF